jgi:hypothetical protein
MSSQEVTADAETQDTMQMTQLLDTLSSPRRRYLIHCLSEQPGPVDVETLADEIYRRESDAGETTHPRQVEISLHHLHLPKLDARDFLDYEAARGEVIPTRETDDASYALVSAGFHD